MQILHPLAGSPQQYLAQPSDPDRYRPAACPQCQANQPLTAHGFYTRTIVDTGFDGSIRIRRYLCQLCRRTVSLLPEFALPYLRSSVAVIALWLLARLRRPQPQPPPTMPYQRGQFWLRRFRRQAESLCAALSALTQPVPAPDFLQRALSMLTASGWIPSHRFLFGALRSHLLGWPHSLAPFGQRVTVSPASPAT